MNESSVTKDIVTSDKQKGLELQAKIIANWLLIFGGAFMTLLASVFKDLILLLEAEKLKESEFSSSLLFSFFSGIIGLLLTFFIIIVLSSSYNSIVRTLKQEIV